MELKAKGVDDVYLEYFNTGKHDLAQVYLRTEVDRYIAELKDRVISMINEKKYCVGYDTQSIVGQIAKVILQYHWNYEVKLDNITQSLEASREIVISSKQLYAKLKSDKKLSEERLYKKLRNQKYKRCLLRSVIAQMNATHFKDLFYGAGSEVLADEYNKQITIHYKWKMRWLALADKFKDKDE